MVWSHSKNLIMEMKIVKIKGISYPVQEIQHNKSRGGT
jgi:hypothetical protein